MGTEPVVEIHAEAAFLDGQLAEILIGRGDDPGLAGFGLI